MITIQLVSSTSLKKIKLTSFDRKQLDSYGFTAKSGEHINLLNEEGGLYKVFLVSMMGILFGMLLQSQKTYHKELIDLRRI